MRTWKAGVAAAADMAARNVWIDRGRCKQRTREAFLIESNGTGSATESWDRAPDRHHATDPSQIPDDCFVWWTGGSDGFGHVAIKTDGRLLSPGTPAEPEEWGWTTFAGMWGNLKLAGWTHSIDGQTPPRPAPPRPPRVARIMLCNLHATSKPVLVVPWLVLQCTRRDVDAVLLQECTPRHAAVLRRVPGWTLVRLRGAAGEAIFVRQRAHTDAVVQPASPEWMGKNTGRPHVGRVIPSVLLNGWLRIASIHLPPGWVDGPPDRRSAGRVYMQNLRKLAKQHRDRSEARFYGGDWNAKPDEVKGSIGLGAFVGPDAIDHARAARCKVTRVRRIRRGPGMDHAAWLYVVQEA